jgi:predicted RecB family nuclease
MKKNFYTPSFFKKYLQCKYIIFNEYNEEKLGLKRKEITKSDDLRFKKGFKHEKEYFNSLKKKYKKVIDIKSLQLPRDEKIKKTLESIHEGYEIIYNGHLDDGKWSGEFDFLEINKNLKSNLGNYSYEILDAKNTSKIKPDHVFQLSVYSDLLEKAAKKEDPSQRLLFVAAFAVSGYACTIHRAGRKPVFFLL